MSEISNVKQRQSAFAAAWFSFLRLCKANNISMNQTIAAKGMRIKRSTFSHAVNYGPSDSVLVRFCRYTGATPESIDTALMDVIPININTKSELPKWEDVKKAANS